MSLEELRACSVKAISREEATEIILRYEALGTLPATPKAFYGLVTPDGEIAGATVFGPGSGTNARNICGTENGLKTVCLERGACVHWAHPNAGSYLVSRACKLAYEEHGWSVIYAYSDSNPKIAEVGIIYQACNWLYIGSGAGRGGGASYHYEALHKPSRVIYSERQIRFNRKKVPEQERHLWTWEHLRESKEWEVRKVLDRARYVHFEGSKTERKHLLRALKYQVQPYPKR